jgi:uncharacterized protein
MSVAELPIEFDQDKVADFCRQRGIARLSFFGSVLRDDFDPRTSDVDVFAEFLPGALRGVGLDYFDYGRELSAILGRNIDFCSRLNKHLQAAVRDEMLVVYEQA